MYITSELSNYQLLLKEFSYFYIQNSTFHYSYYVISETYNEKIDLKIDICPIYKLNLDFDINGLYLFSRSMYKHHFHSFQQDIDNVILNCKKRIFTITEANIPSFESLIKRYNYMLSLGYKYNKRLEN